MNLRIDSPGKSSAFVDIFCKTTDRCLLHRLRMHLSVPVGIVNKREGIQNPTLTAKAAGQAYPKKILLMN